MNILFAIACALSAQANETTVNAKRGADIDDARVTVDDDALASPDPENALSSAAGAALVHDGGPLAPARPMVRGLGGARLGVDVGGLDLADPATGLVDAAFLPWSALDDLDVDTGADASSADVAGRVHLGLWRGSGVRARLLAGSLETTRASLAAANDSALVAIDGAFTKGDFAYLPSSATAPSSTKDVVRDNNDQKRASILAAAQTRAGDVTLDAIAFAGGHSGGIAGLAGAPPLDLRGDDALAGARVSARRSLGDVVTAWSNAKLGVALDARVSHRATWPGDGSTVGLVDAEPQSASTSLSAIESTSTNATVSLSHAAIADDAWLDVASGVERAALVDGSFTRFGTSASIAAHATWATPIGDVRTRAAVDGRALDDAGFLWGGELRGEVGDVVRASLGIARASRAPTLDELYAPRGLVLGNPRLVPEAADDIEAAVAFVPGSVVDARFVAFAGALENAIAYVNKNAFAIEPINLGFARRAGFDISTTLEPSNWTRLDVVAEVLASTVDATGAPLPLAAPFSSRIALRVGEAEGAHVVGALRSRAKTPSNSFGTLEASPYHLVDLVARVPFATNLAVAIDVENVLDVKDARDANQLPLPGRLFFVSLEVHS